jgi:hypothetical protein
MAIIDVILWIDEMKNVKKYKIQVSIIEIVDEEDKEKNRLVDTLYVNAYMSALEFHKNREVIRLMVAQRKLQDACNSIVFCMTEKFVEDILRTKDD